MILTGSGWAFSAAGAIEAVNAIATGKLVSLSAQELIDCVQESQGCYNGWHYQSFEWVIRNGGIASEADYPYKGKETRCRANKVRQLPFHNFTSLSLHTLYYY